MKRLNITFGTILLALGCIAFSPRARALNPPPDGGYLNQTTAEGDGALFSLTTGFGNTALGFNALNANTTGSLNAATGRNALLNNTTGDNNTADGSAALLNNMTGNFNAATGRLALFSNATGSGNTANGFYSLGNNTDGSRNTANGVAALFNTAGSDNIAMGFGAGDNLTTGDNNIDVGNLGVADEANTIRIGEQVAVYDPNTGDTMPAHTRTFIAGISVPIAGPTVHISGTGQLGIGPPSSARFKQNVKPMDRASEAILALKPVTFHYKKELDPEGIPQFGLVAEEVAKVNQNLVARDAAGKVYTVRYEAVNAMLLNEFLKEHRQVQEQEATITQLKLDFQSKLAEQQKEIQVLAVGLKEQASQIQKVSAQLEMSKPAPRTVVDNH